MQLLPALLLGRDLQLLTSPRKASESEACPILFCILLFALVAKSEIVSAVSESQEILKLFTGSINVGGVLQRSNCSGLEAPKDAEANL